VPDHIVDVRLFRYALASAEHGSFRRVAAALNVQQSTVSKGIRNLEHRLGVTLFERSHSGIRPTVAGVRFLEEASLGFDHLRKAVQRIGTFQRGEYGELVVAASVPFILFGDMFERLRDQYQSVALEIAENTCSGSCMSVRQRKVDIAFVAKPADDTLRSLHLRDERMNVLLPISHRLAGARAVVLEDLRRERFILGASGVGPEIEDHLRHRMTKTGDEPNIRLHHVGQCDLANMVARGFGLTIVAGRSSHTPPDGVVLVPLAGKNVVPIYAVWVNSNPNPALKALLSVVQRSAALRPQHNASRHN